MGSRKIIVAVIAVLLCLGATAQTVVSSLTELQPYLNDNDVHVVMTPGTYRITVADCGSSGSGRFPVAPVFTFSGTNTVFDFTGVTFEFETGIFQRFGNVDVKEIAIFGQNQVLKNLTMIDVGTTRPSRTALGVLLDGHGNRVEGFNLTVRGSQPYGYGDIFGKGSGYVIKHYKHSAILVRGESNHLLNCKIFHRSYGHGIFCQGSQDAIIEGCYVEGEVRTTDDVLAEEGSGSSADDKDFVTNWGEDENGENGYRLPPGWMFSLQEDGIRAYNTGPGLDGETVNTRNMQVIDCTVYKMRNGVTIGFCDNTKDVDNCVALGTETGYWVGTEGEVTDSAGDAVYGPLLVNAYQNNRDSVVNLTVLENKERYGNDILAYTGGSGHNLTFRSRDEYVDPNLRIMMAGIRTGMRQYAVNPTYNDFSTSNVDLYNYTQYPVEMYAKSSGTSGRTDGSVLDLGSGNSLSQIPVSTAGGFGVIQVIQAEDFSSQSGSSIQTRGDGVRFIGADHDGDWICFEDFFLGSGPNRFEAFVMDGGAAGSVELRRDSASGELLGTLPVPANGGLWSAETVSLDEPRTKCDLYLVFKGPDGKLPKIDRFRLYVDFEGRQESKGLIGHWKFDDATGTVAIDSSGYGHHGTVTSASWTNGKKGGALDFSPGSAAVSIPVSAFDTVQEEITIAFWAYGAASQPANNSAFYAAHGTDRVLNIHLPYGSSKIYWDAGYESGYDRIEKTASAAEFKGSWSHWVFSKNTKTGNMRIYRNGSLWHAGISKIKEIDEITAAVIGNQPGGSLNYKGLLDDVRLYDVELMEHEVAELFNTYDFTDAGTPHSWFDAYGLVSGADYEAAALQDADADGLSNDAEFGAGTDPTNAASVLSIIPAEHVADSWVLSWPGLNGKTYDIWVKDDMTDRVWELQEGNIQGLEPSCTRTVSTDNATGFITIEVNR